MDLQISKGIPGQVYGYMNEASTSIQHQVGVFIWPAAEPQFI